MENLFHVDVLGFPHQGNVCRIADQIEQ